MGYHLFGRPTERKGGMNNGNPFDNEPTVDPRAEALQTARDEMAAGKGATVSLTPNYELLKHLTQWMAERGYEAIQVAHAVREPHLYWEYFKVEIDAIELTGALNEGVKKDA
jgi:hypothetical protein